MNKKEEIYLKNRLLEISKEVERICQKFEIPYYLTGGSCLGAVRHKGFVPWDDDIDIMMVRKDYIRFLDACQLDLDQSRFSLEVGFTDKRPMPFSKIRRRGTKIIEKHKKSTSCSEIFVDIFPLYSGGKKKIGLNLQWFFSRIIVAKSACEEGVKPRNFIKMSLSYLAGIIPLKAMKKLKVICDKLENEDSRHMINLYHRGTFKENIFFKDVLGNPVYVPFEGIYLPVPERANRYLESRFGKNWRELPPIVEQKSSHVKSVVL